MNQYNFRVNKNPGYIELKIVARTYKRAMDKLSQYNADDIRFISVYVGAADSY